jgi:hypothetical protein
MKGKGKGKGKRNFRVCALLLLAIAIKDNASAQLTLTGTSYTQTFDNINNGLPAGWSVRTNATSVSLGTAVTFNTNATAWATTIGQFANYAATVNNGTNFGGLENSATQSACTNRSPGLRQTGSFADPGGAFVLQILNTLGLEHFELSVDLCMLNRQGRTNLWLIDYGIGADPAAFTAVWTNSDPGVFGSTTRTVSFDTALDNQPQNVWIRFATLEPSTGFGSRDTFGIDNFQLIYEPLGTVAPIPLRIELIGTNAVLTWNNPAFALEAAPRVTGMFTNVSGATSPHTNPIAGSQKFFRLKAN